MPHGRSARGGNPYAPAIFTLASLLIVLNALWTDLVTPIMQNQPWGPSAAGFLVIGLGLPVYALIRSRAR